MRRNQKQITTDGSVTPLLILLNVVILKQGYISGASWYSFGVLSLFTLAIVLILPATEPGNFENWLKKINRGK